MELTARPEASENEELITFGFYDEEKLYGVGFSRVSGEDRIELMVADQSCYELRDAWIQFSNNYFHMKLPSGTIKRTDGEDEYTVRFSTLTDNEYRALQSTLQRILAGHATIELHCT